MVPVKQQQPNRMYCFIVEEYHSMGEASIFHEYDQLELINGGVMHTSPIDQRHINSFRHLKPTLSAWALRNSNSRTPVFVSVQDPFALDNRGELQPNLTFLRVPSRAACRDPAK